MSAASLRLPGWLPAANRVVKMMNRLGVPLGTIRVLEIPGRVSGLSRATPVSPLLLSGRRFVIAGLPDADWALNARAAAHGELVRGRRREPVRLIEVDELALRREVMRAFPVEVPHGVPLFVKIGLVSGADPGQFAAAADQVAVFELVPADDHPRQVRRPGHPVAEPRRPRELLRDLTRPQDEVRAPSADAGGCGRSPQVEPTGSGQPRSHSQPGPRRPKGDPL